ncbi:MAG: MFS transporter [Fimbriimonadales bacterium]|nr:MFS transporter [Fimbriimonadales bacterium]
MSSAGLPEVPSPYAGRKLTAPIHLALAAYWMGSNFLWGAMLVVLLPKQIEDMEPTRRGEYLGLAFSLAAVVALVVPLIVGGWSDRCASRWGRRRPYIVWGTLLTLVGLWAMAHFGRMLLFWPFLAAYCLVQLGNNTATAAYSGVIPDLVPQDQRGTASGYMALLSQVGTLLGALISGPLVQANRLETVYLVIGLTLAAAMLVTVLGIRENPLPFRPDRLSPIQHLRSLWIDPRRHPDFAWVWLTRALVMLGFYAVQPFVQYYLRDVIGVTTPASTASEMLGLILVGATISSFVGGHLSDRIGRKRVVYFANGVVAAMAFALTFCRTLEQALVVGVLFGLGYGAYISVDWALGTDVLPSRKDAGKDMAVWHISMVLPQTISPAAAGLLLGVFGTSPNLAAATSHAIDLAARAVPWMVWRDPGFGGIVEYPEAGYGVVFALAALSLGLGAVLLRNVRGAR